MTSSSHRSPILGLVADNILHQLPLSRSMDLGTLMDSRTMAAMQQPQHHHHHHHTGTTPDRQMAHLPQLTARNLPEPPMDRSGSPHGSEHSRYSAPRSVLDGMPRSYHSPGPMNGAPMSMTMPGHPQQQHIAPPAITMILPGAPPDMGMPKMNTAPQAQVKAFPCGTCGKRFARRSDLARHGKLSDKPAT